MDFELREKTMLMDKLTSPTSPFAGMMAAAALNGRRDTAVPPIPEKVKDLMAKSPGHPEVEEIDGSDEIIGVRFEAENYPPGFEEED